jgi:hypothetical protein
MFVAFAVAGVLLLPGIAWSLRLAHPVAWAMAGFVLTMFVSGGFVVFALADGLEKQREGGAGFLAGFCISSWALATGVLMPVVGRMFDGGRYAESLWLMAATPLAGVGLWTLLRERRGVA